MKAEELMIGDWVYNTHNRQRERVAEIGSGLVMLDYNDLYEYDEIEPIPITGEILVQNGLRKVEVPGEKGMQTYYIDPHIAGYYNMSPLERLHRSCIVYDPASKWAFFNSEESRVEIFCGTVNKFQHGLKLAGLSMDLKLEP